MLRAGIVGLPNVGKSTLFNALTRSRKADSGNYPFCTIDPNVGVIEVPDKRLVQLAELSKSKKIIPAAIEILDIAGLVSGASKGEGLGNQFLSNIREADAIIHVVRCFEDVDIVHSIGPIDPIRDIEVINTELILADIQSVELQIAKSKKKKTQQSQGMAIDIKLLESLLEHLNSGKPAIIFPQREEFGKIYNNWLLSGKNVLYACNISEADFTQPCMNSYVTQVQKYVTESYGAGSCVVCAKIEAELAILPIQDAQDYLEVLEIDKSGVSQLISATYSLLGLASYFTSGEQETRAWTFKQGMKAPECAGVIHTDFEAGFIKAEVVSSVHLIEKGSIARTREAGKYRLEGKDYLFLDGDVVLFRFSN